MYKVKQRFIDVLNEKHIYEADDLFKSKDLKRIEDLLNRELVVEVDDKETQAEMKKKSE